MTFLYDVRSQQYQKMFTTIFQNYFIFETIRYYFFCAGQITIRIKTYFKGLFQLSFKRSFKERLKWKKRGRMESEIMLKMARKHPNHNRINYQEWKKLLPRAIQGTNAFKFEITRFDEYYCIYLSKAWIFLFE